MGFFLQQLANGVVLGSVYALYAAGFGLVMANLRIFHVAHAAVFTWGAVVAWQLTNGEGWPLLAALPLVMVATGVLNAVTYVVLVRHLLDRPGSDLAAFVSSLGGLIVLAEVAHLALHSTVQRMPIDSFPVHPITLGPVRVTTLQLTMVVLAVCLIGGISWVLARTHLGREIRAVAHDRHTAGLLGVNADRVTASVFFISGALAGLAAALVAAAFNVVGSDLGSTYLIVALAALVVGGFGHVVGALAGGLCIGLVSTLATGYLSASYRDLTVFALLLLFLVVRPQGLFRTRDDLARA